MPKQSERAKLLRNIEFEKELHVIRMLCACDDSSDSESSCSDTSDDEDFHTLFEMHTVVSQRRYLIQRRNAPQPESRVDYYLYRMLPDAFKEYILAKNGF